jgi:hypothetical protein
MEQNDSPQSPTPTAARPCEVGLFVELGRPRAQEIKRLKRGNGALSQQIRLAVDRWREQLGIESAAEVVPVVLLYRHDEPYQVVVVPTAYREQ